MNSWQRESFEQEFKNLKYDTALKELFSSDIMLVSSLEECKLSTPRETLLTKIFSIAPLWYIQFLIKANPSRIVDLGCGGNFFKSVIEKLYGIPVYGIDPTSLNADEINFFNSEFSQGHTNAYESVFSINAIHFTSLNELAKTIREFHNIVAPGGHAFLALNATRMLERSDKEWLLKEFGSVKPTPHQVHDYVRDQLNTLYIDFLIVDLLIDTVPDEYLDGNIRLVFKK